MIGAGRFKFDATFLKEVPSFLPAPAIWVYLTALAQIAAGISFLIRRLDALAGVLLALLLLVYAAVIWLPGVTSADHPAVFKASVGGGVKDLGLAAGPC